MKKTTLCAITISSVLLSSCAHHLSKQACENTNWAQMGFQDGQQGKGQRDFSGYIKDCNKFHISINTDVYARGWDKGTAKYCYPSKQAGQQWGQSGKSYDQMSADRSAFCDMANHPLKLDLFKQGFNVGIKSFCTYQKGYDIAMAAQQLPGVCPANLQKAFMSGWNNGVAKFCGNTANGFALGKAGKSLPGVCNTTAYSAFKNEYSRGHAIHNRIADLSRQISDINQTISGLTFKYHLNRISETEYQLGDKKSPDAQQALSQVMRLIRHRARIKSERFSAQTKH